MPTEKTKADYRRLAAHFYKQRLGDEPPSPKRITDSLKACAGEYRPAYWRRLRGALVFDQQEKGFSKAAERIKNTINPQTTDQHGPLDKGLRGPVPSKQRRAKSISAEDLGRLKLAARKLKAGQEVLAALSLAEELGVRPAEMLSLRVDQARGVVHVTGAKRNAQRGADRVLQPMITEPWAMRSLAVSVETLRDAEEGSPGVIHRVQARLDRVTRKLWPRRKMRPTLYTLRHQMGSELKASGASRAAIAYAMGHQSTQSVEVYGDRRSAKRSGGLTIEAGDREAAAFQGRENHTAPHEPREAQPATPVVQQEEAPVQPPTPAPYVGPSGPGM
ncbi:MAG: site-specific integrase [Halomonas sp.]|nr:site-specific integrase [Halomonas sp.]MDN6337226.1 site-specific integrase [Halomonas sp.]